MKNLKTILLALIALAMVAYLPVYGQARQSEPSGIRSDELSPSFSAVQEADPYPLGKAAIFFNPLGFLQFGPVMGVEFKMFSTMFLDFHIRPLFFGLFYQGLESDWEFDDKVSVGSMSIGSGVKYYMKKHGRKHCMYVGGLIEYAWGSTKDDDEYGWEIRHTHLALAGNVGYSLRFGTFFLNLGAVLGIVPDLTREGREWYWYSGGWRQEDWEADDKQFNFYGMLEATIGFVIVK